MEILNFLGGITALQAVIFFFGLLFLVIEMFHPGFGVFGGTGLVLLVIGIVITAKTFTEALIMVLILLVLVTFLVIIVYRSVKKGRLSKILVLDDQQKNNAGFVSQKDSSALLGVRGVALTTLRPAGTAQFENLKLDVVTQGEFISKGNPVKVIETNGGRIVVELLK